MKSKGKILIVDDHVPLLEACRLWFEDENYEVRTAVSGENALKVISNHRMDILITDYSMPGMNGIELISKVVKRNRNIRIIMITQFGDLNSAKQCLRLGISDYLEKQNELKCIQKDGEIDMHKLQQYVDQTMRESLRTRIVKAMNMSLLIWQQQMKNSQKNGYKADFAEKSGLWQIQNDNGNLRTRGLDRYLDIHKLPAKPKKHLILNSIEFVLNRYKDVEKRRLKELEELYNSINDTIWIEG